jgi:molecular chaperone HtpG
MSAQEAIDHLGTIAKSGTKDFMGKLSGDQKADAQLIGQFGVGFYSGFIVADKITVESRRAGLPADEGVRWVSGGTGDFEVEPSPAPRAAPRHPAPARRRRGVPQRLEAQLISKYSDHISLPILMEKEEWKKGETKPGEWSRPANGKPSTRPARCGPAQEGHHRRAVQGVLQGHQPRLRDPLTWSHNRVEGNTEYTQLLYIPAKAPFDLYQRDKHAASSCT